ncbi:DUF1127 domain-containing protein [Methylobacterium sp. ID0610]|uniref:DUF1127 domain-containing protein n=1 Tax=Methylobacterium carpenticola TaxID=3344827 RepID=UPI00369529B1
MTDLALSRPTPRAHRRMSRLAALLARWLRNHRTRLDLRDLPPHLLADIGLSEDEWRAECGRAFWREARRWPDAAAPPGLRTCR